MKRRKDGRYQKVITINGKKHFFYSSADTERTAERDIQRQILQFTEKEELGKTFGEVADEWENHHAPHIAYTTAHRYSSLLNHSKNYFENTYIKRITPKEIERFSGDFASKGYTTKTIKDTMSVLRMVFKYAYVHEYIASDPSRYVATPKGKPSTRREALTDKEIEIVNKSIGCSDGFLPFFLLYTGLRKGEALALQFKDVDIKNRIIHVTKSVYHESNVPRLKTPKTSSGTRTVILLDVLAERFPTGKPDEYIFSIDGKRPFANSAFERHWAKYCKETGLNVTPHQLRHTYATILFEAGIDVKDAQNLMGHSDITITRNIYTHIRQQRKDQTAATLNNFLNKENSSD